MVLLSPYIVYPDIYIRREAEPFPHWHPYRLSGTVAPLLTSRDKTSFKNTHFQFTLHNQSLLPVNRSRPDILLHSRHNCGHVECHIWKHRLTYGFGAVWMKTACDTVGQTGLKNKINSCAVKTQNIMHEHRYLSLCSALANPPLCCSPCPSVWGLWGHSFGLLVWRVWFCDGKTMQVKACK